MLWPSGPWDVPPRKLNRPLLLRKKQNPVLFRLLHDPRANPLLLLLLSPILSDSDTVPAVIEVDSESELTSPDNETDTDGIDMATIAILGKNKGSNDEEFVDTRVEQEAEEEEEEEEEEDEDEIEDECQDDEEEDKDFDLEFIIPVASNAADTITFSSTITFLEFTQQVADEMNIRCSDLQIGYKLKHWTKDILPRVLTTPIHLIRLFNSAREELDARAKTKKSSKKPLQVTIFDLRSKLPEKETKKATKKPKSKASKKAESDDDDDAEGKTGKKTGPQYLCELEATHKCEKHTGFCLVAQNGEHVSLSGPNLSLWSMLCAQGAHESTSVPPTVLGLSTETGTKAAPASRRPPTQQPPAPGPYPYSFYAPTGPYPQPYYPPPPPLPPIPTASPKSSAKPSKPSVDSDDDDESPTLFPKIDDWLLDLDSSERGEDGHGFVKFGAVLRDHGFVCVVQLVDLGGEGEKMLLTICTGMTLGVAKLLMKYAKVDCKKVRKQEAERKAEWAA
ncbi:hypothetical protein C8R44DRAFT_340389 [Mycena epipterygia]|nr:hypothetical protein C8R44DRAFT_340389 [Mycena epipterygia]